MRNELLHKLFHDTNFEVFSAEDFNHFFAFIYLFIFIFLLFIAQIYCTIGY